MFPTPSADGLGLSVVDFESLEVRRIPGSAISFPSEYIPRQHVAFSADSTAVYWADARSPLDIYRASLAGGPAQLLAFNPTAGALAFAPDFIRVATLVPGNPPQLWTSDIKNGANPHQLGAVSNAFAWRPSQRKLPTATTVLCESFSAVKKQGPLKMGWQAPHTACWQDIEGEASYNVEGWVVHWSLDPDFKCETGGPPILWLSGEVPFSADLPANSDRFELPEARDVELGASLIGVKDFRIDVQALDADGEILVLDGVSLTKDPPPCPPAGTDISLKPPDADTPAAGICAGPPDGEIVTVEMQQGVPSPRCARALPSQRLRIVNLLDRTITFSIGAFEAVLKTGEEATSDSPLGAVLAPGVHVIQSDAYGGGSGEIWLAPSPALKPSETP